MKFFEGDTVKVTLSLIDTLFFSAPQFIDNAKEGIQIIPKYKLMLKQKTGKVIEKDFHTRKNQWSYHVVFPGKTTENEDIMLWFLESELYLL